MLFSILIADGDGNDLSGLVAENIASFKACHPREEHVLFAADRRPETIGQIVTCQSTQQNSARTQGALSLSRSIRQIA